MATFIRPTADQLAEIGGSIATRFTAAVVHLLKAAIPLTPTMLAADCLAQEADFDGYAATTYAGPPVPYPDVAQNGVAFTIPTQTFIVAASPAVVNDVYGAYILAAGGTLIMCILFGHYFPMRNAGDQINMEISINYFGSGGILVTVNGELV